MYAPIFTVVSQAPAAAALLGNDPVRFWPFGEAEEGAALPYAVWQAVGGQPQNYLAGAPSMDDHTLQVDVYADSVPSARAVALALRDAIEPHAYIAAWRGESKERETGLYRFSFDVDWLVER